MGGDDQGTAFTTGNSRTWILVRRLTDTGRPVFFTSELPVVLYKVSVKTKSKILLAKKLVLNTVLLAGYRWCQRGSNDNHSYRY